MSQDLDDKIKETVKLYTELMKIIAILFAGTAGGLSSLIVRGWTSAREVMVVSIGIIFFVGLTIAFMHFFRITKNLLR
jgi:hypothetical protein